MFLKRISRLEQGNRIQGKCLVDGSIGIKTRKSHNKE